MNLRNLAIWGTVILGALAIFVAVNRGGPIATPGQNDPTSANNRNIEPWTIAVGNKSDMRETADLLEKVDGAITDDYVARSKQSREQAKAIGDRPATWRISDAFHATLVRECGNRTLVQVVGALERDETAGMPRSPEDIAGVLDAHRVVGRRVHHQQGPAQ